MFKALIVSLLTLSAIIANSSVVYASDSAPTVDTWPELTVTDEDEITKYLLFACFVEDIKDSKGRAFRIGLTANRYYKTYISRGFVVKSLVLKDLWVRTAPSAMNPSHGRVTTEFDVVVNFEKPSNGKVATMKAHSCYKAEEF